MTNRSEGRVSGSSWPLGLEPWIALNEEIAALAGAGLPLPGGLARFASDRGGALAAVSRRMADRLERGDSLLGAIEAEGDALPPLQGAVVAAGLRSGSLPSALQALSEFARNQLELRRTLGVALVYPLILLFVGYGLFVGLLVFVVPRLADAFRELRVPGLRVVELLERAGAAAPSWAPWPPAILAAGVMAWIVAGWARSFPGLPLMGRVLPGSRRMLDDGLAATYCELMAMLVEQGVPLPEALELAGAASGDAAWDGRSRELAELVRGGRPLGGDDEAIGRMPALLRLALTAPADEAVFLAALRHAASVYRDRLQRRAEWIRRVWPLAIVVVLGGAVALVYVLTLYVPLTALLEGIAEQA